MLVSTVACGTPDEQPSDTGTSTNASTDAGQPESEAETKDPNFICDLPDNLDYDEDTIVCLYPDVNNRKDEFVPDPAGGVVSEAVHERNVAVEEQLSVKLEMLTADNLVDALKLDYQTGTVTYEIISMGTSTAITPAIEGYYLDLNALENINTSKHYWTQGYNDMVTFTDENMQFLASGPLAISMFRYMFLTIYNKELFKDYKVEDLYDVVKAGKWTLDYQYSVLEGKYLDKDADNKRSEGDFYGFVTGDTVSVDPYLVAADIHMIAKDGDTKQLYYNKEAVSDLSNLCDKVQKIYNDPGAYVYKGATQDDVPKTYIINHFNSGNAMMATTLFLQMELNFNDLSRLTYGIAPLPKYDELQPTYNSYVQDQVSAFGISAAITDTAEQNKVAAVLEALAYHSYLLVRPAYYETALSERYMQDPQSSEVLDMIFDTLRFDFSSSCCNIFKTCVLRDNLRPLLSGQSNTIASASKSWTGSINGTLIRKINPKLETLKPGN